jgi:hypothetical protein
VRIQFITVQRFKSIRNLKKQFSKMEKFVAWSGETTERNGTQYKMQTPHPVLPKNIFLLV